MQTPDPSKMARKGICVLVGGARGFAITYAGEQGYLPRQIYEPGNPFKDVFYYGSMCVGSLGLLATVIYGSIALLRREDTLE